MKAAIKKEFDVEVTLKEADGGIFEVALNNRVVFSNLEENRFPENEEVFERIRQHQAPA